MTPKEFKDEETRIRAEHPLTFPPNAWELQAYARAFTALRVRRDTAAKEAGFPIGIQR